MDVKACTHPLIGVPCVLLAAWMTQNWIPDVKLLEGCLLCLIPTVFLLPPCFDYTEHLIPELLPALTGLWGMARPASSHDQPDSDSSDSSPQAKEQQYALILGLDPACILPELKKRYHELAQQYHPDKVQHLGPKLRLTAEQEMKKINEAYRYFERRTE